MNELEMKVALIDETPKPVAKKKGPAKKVVSQVAVVEVPQVPAFIDPVATRKAELRTKIAQERAYKAKLVTGKFLFNECPGGELKFAFREFPGDQLITYVMRHDSIHTVPLGVAMHLNDRCSYPEYFHNLDGGKAISADNMYITTKVHRTSFIPLDFTADVGNYSGKSIAQVSNYNPLDNKFSLDSLGR